MALLVFEIRRGFGKRTPEHLVDTYQLHPTLGKHRKEWIGYGAGPFAAAKVQHLPQQLVQHLLRHLLVPSLQRAPLLCRGGDAAFPARCRALLRDLDGLGAMELKSLIEQPLLMAQESQSIRGYERPRRSRRPLGATIAVDDLGRRAV